jgi:muramoyltetrapeptide carboxypeptidase
MIRVISTAAPVEEPRLRRGCEELAALGYRVALGPHVAARHGYFAGPGDARLGELAYALSAAECHAVICSRGGYGTTYLLDQLEASDFRNPKILVGFSDVTALHVFLWQELGWVTFYGPMAAAGFDAGPGVPNGYDRDSFLRAVTETRTGWSLSLHGETLAPGEADGVLVGGCLTLIRSTIGTPWELDTRDTVLLLEDLTMKPYQVDRALMHLKQAGKFEGVRGILLGEFPECDPPTGSDVTVRDVLLRLLAPLEVPVLWRAPVGHTPRPVLTVPLGVRVRLEARGSGQLHILEPAVA